MEEGFWAYLGKIFNDAINEALTEYGPGIVLLILAIIALFSLHERLWSSRLRDKDREIARIASQRDKLDAILLQNRIGAKIDSEGNPLGD